MGKLRFFNILKHKQNKILELDCFQLHFSIPRLK